MLRSRKSAPPAKKTPFERFASYRDVGVLVTGLAYALGYASRSLHAFNYNLGALPGVRFEYLVAGALLLIPPTVLCLVLWSMWLIAKRLAAWAAACPNRKGRVSNTLLGSVFLSMFVAMSVKNSSVVNGAFSVFIVSIFFWLLFLNASEEPFPATATAPIGASPPRWRRLLDPLGRILLYLWGGALALNLSILLLLILFLAVLFGANALTHVPQEFGGVKPKCGVLDLVPEHLSPELRTLLVGSDLSIDPKSKVLRSKPLDVYATNHPWLIRVRGTLAGEHTRSIRLSGGAVQSVEWCR